MAIRYEVLGAPGRDNALFVEVDTGQAIYRLLFDCGEACLRDLTVAQLQQIDGLLFSHFHIDHVAGFDSFLRSNYNRADRPVWIWGPAGATEVIQHRLRGVTWNLVAAEPGEFVVTEIHADRLISCGFLTREGFGAAHPRGEQVFHGAVVFEGADYRIDAQLMDHGTPSVAYCLREPARWNIDTARLAAMKLRPGPWLKKLKTPTADPRETVQADGTTYQLGDLRERLLVRAPGDAIAYLTDFRLDGPSEDQLVAMLSGCRTLVCENNFRDVDGELAARSRHMVSTDVGRLAARVQAERLVLFHLSDRYTPEEWQQQLAEVRARFPQTCFPESWSMPPHGLRV